MQLAIPTRTARSLRALRDHAAIFERYRGFDRCMRRLTADADEPPSLATISELYAHWGDPLTQGGESYLRSCLAEARAASGPIVQCGAGLLSLVLGSLCQTSAVPARQLWCLEHDPHWANTIRSWLTQYRMGRVHVITSRPHLFEEFVWYAADPERLASGVSLVLCEGGRAAPSGVPGALARLEPRLADPSIVLARGVGRADDLRRAHQWAKDHGASCVVVDREQGFVKITRRNG